MIKKILKFLKGLFSFTYIKIDSSKKNMQQRRQECLDKLKYIKNKNKN